MLLLFSAALGCEPASVVEILKVAAEIPAGFGEQDLERMVRAKRTVEASLPCTTTKFTPADAARLLRQLGLEAWVAEDRDRARAAFETSRHLEPVFRFDEGLLPPKHPLRAFHEGIPEEAAPASVELPEPASGYITVNGRTGRTAPVGRAWVFQRFGPDGTVLQTRLVWDEAPTYAVRERASPWLQVGVGALLVPSETGRVFGSVAAGLRVPLVGPLDLDVGVQAGFGGHSGDRTRLQVLPLGRLGARITPVQGVVTPWFGAGALVGLNGAPFAVSAGGAGWAGLAVGREVRWMVELQAGMLSPRDGGPVSGLGQLSTGVALAL